MTRLNRVESTGAISLEVGKLAPTEAAACAGFDFGLMFGHFEPELRTLMDLAGLDAIGFLFFEISTSDQTLHVAMAHDAVWIDDVLEGMARTGELDPGKDKEAGVVVEALRLS
ncbi:MAG: hypothetical protein EXS25_12810 [Pedosphaera sp.]|nr:hypothetical protein [Pedosphaera sp.]